MSLWRYKAIPAGGGAATSGEVAGDDAASVRATLRRAGLRVIDLRESRSSSVGSAPRTLRAHLRRRRQARKAELYDGWATMLEAGMPLLDAVTTLRESATGRTRGMLAHIAESLRGGDSLADAMIQHTAWFDETECAMARAGQLSGELATVLRSMASRLERAGELGGKLAGALTYPAVVAAVGVGVLVFLSTQTLPDLLAILDGAGIDPPWLTRVVIAVGGGLATLWPILLGVIVLALIAGLFGARWLRSRGVAPPAWTGRLIPGLVRRVAVARAMLTLADLLRAGVPLVDALKATARTQRLLGSRLDAAASSIEGGTPLADALPDRRWFDAELIRLIEVAERAGELDAMLTRIGGRYERRASRLIDRLATLIEPAVILVLAALIGLVAMAAVLPLTKLQEVL